MFSFGTIPDILMGKDPKKALQDNLMMAGMVLGGMAAAPAMGAGAAGSAAGASGAASGASQAGAALASNPYTSLEFLKDAAASSTGASTGGGLLSTMGAGLDMAGKAAPLAGMLQQGGQSQPVQPAQLPQFQELGGLLNDGGMEALKQKRLQRRGLME